LCLDKLFFLIYSIPTFEKIYIKGKKEKNRNKQHNSNEIKRKKDETTNAMTFTYFIRKN
jgi:hypothetical protein